MPFVAQEQAKKISRESKVPIKMEKLCSNRYSRRNSKKCQLKKVGKFTYTSVTQNWSAICWRTCGFQRQHCMVPNRFVSLFWEEKKYISSSPTDWSIWAVGRIMVKGCCLLLMIVGCSKCVCVYVCVCGGGGTQPSPSPSLWTLLLRSHYQSVPNQRMLLFSINWYFCSTVL